MDTIALVVGYALIGIGVAASVGAAGWWGVNRIVQDTQRARNLRRAWIYWHKNGCP